MEEDDIEPLKEDLAVDLPDVWSGLTHRQKEIQRLRLRGFTQTSIGKILGFSQPLVFKELRRIKEVHRKRGTSIDKESYAGEVVTKFDDIEEKAWNLFYNSAPKEKKPGNSAVQIQALQLISSVQAQKTKLLMELGVLERVARRFEHEHDIKPRQPTLVDNWDTKGRAQLAAQIIVSQMETLPEPEPPEEGELIEEPNGQI